MATRRREKKLRALEYELSSSHTDLNSASSSIRYQDSLSSSWLSEQIGKKCFMLCARELQIAREDNIKDWNWISLPESRFSEVAVLRYACRLDIYGIMQSRMLSPNTNYASYLVYKLTEEHEGLDCSANASIKIVGLTEIEVDTSTVYIVPPSYVIDGRLPSVVPHMRNDGWMEIKIGTFCSDDICKYNHRIHMRLSNGMVWMSGLVIEGIEVRPVNTILYNELLKGIRYVQRTRAGHKLYQYLNELRKDKLLFTITFLIIAMAIPLVFFVFTGFLGLLIGFVRCIFSFLFSIYSFCFRIGGGWVLKTIN